jgi:hypothetical protein
MIWGNLMLARNGVQALTHSFITKHITHYAPSRYKREESLKPCVWNCIYCAILRVIYLRQFEIPFFVILFYTLICKDSIFFKLLFSYLRTSFPISILKIALLLGNLFDSKHQ